MSLITLTNVLPHTNAHTLNVCVYIIDPPSKQPIIRKFNSIKISFSRDNPYLLLPSSSKILPLLVIAAETVLLLTFLLPFPQLPRLSGRTSNFPCFIFASKQTQHNKTPEYRFTCLPLHFFIPSPSLFLRFALHFAGCAHLLLNLLAPLAVILLFLHWGICDFLHAFFTRFSCNSGTEHKNYGTQLKNPTKLLRFARIS